MSLLDELLTTAVKNSYEKQRPKERSSGSISATDRNSLLGMFADSLGSLNDYAQRKDPSMPMGKANPVLGLLADTFGLPGTANTVNELSYGNYGALGTGKGMTWKPKQDTVDAVTTLLPLSATAGKAALDGGVKLAQKATPAIEAAVNRTMANGGKPAQLLGDLAHGTRSYAINPSDFGLPVNKDGTVTLLHGTTKDGAKGIIGSNRLKSAGEPDVYLTTSPNAGYGDGTVVRVNVDPKKLFLDDEFPDGRFDFRLPARSGSAQVANASLLDDTPKFTYPQDAALETARQNGVKMLGLPENNTPMDRAKALGHEDGFVHFSRHGIDTNVLDSGQYAMAPFDAVGTHVGSPSAALDRFNNTVATTDQMKGSTYPVMIRKGEQFISPETGGAWTEDALNAALLDRGGYATAKETFPALNAKLRKDVFKGSGYDSIPYVNDVEGKGTVSHIVPPWNIRSRFAAFDPARVNEADLLAGAMPFGLLLDPENRAKLGF